MTVRRRIGLVVALLLTGSGCGFLRNQVQVASEQGCVKQECRSLDASDYTRCEAACRNRYGR